MNYEEIGMILRRIREENLVMSILEDYGEDVFDYCYDTQPDRLLELIRQLEKTKIREFKHELMYSRLIYDRGLEGEIIDEFKEEINNGLEEVVSNEYMDKVRNGSMDLDDTINLHFVELLGYLQDNMQHALDEFLLGFIEAEVEKEIDQFIVEELLGDINRDAQFVHALIEECRPDIEQLLTKVVQDNKYEIIDLYLD